MAEEDQATIRCSNHRCTRGNEIEGPQFLCRCDSAFCSEACWIQGWHAGHQASCPQRSLIMAEAMGITESDEPSSQRRGTALLASIALRRRQTGAVKFLQNEELDVTMPCEKSEGSKSKGILLEAESSQCLRPTTSPEKPSIEDFLEIAELGTGATGRVTKVFHKGSGKVFALKAIDRTFVAEHRLQQYVLREVATQFTLDHPKVIRLHDFFQDARRIYLLLEFAPGGHLFSLIRKQGHLSEKQAASVFTDVVQALVYLHSKGVAHRDLKPENVLLFEDGRAKLADFGWCGEMTEDGRKTFCGTMDYLSPEMISRDPHDHRVDTWAAGVLLYEMLVGQPPFQGRNTGESLNRILSGDLRIPESVPKGAQNLINGLLKVDPSERLNLSVALGALWLEETSQRISRLSTRGSCALPISTLQASPSDASTSASVTSFTSCLQPRMKRPMSFSGESEALNDCVAEQSSSLEDSILGVISTPALSLWNTFRGVDDNVNEDNNDSVSKSDIQEVSHKDAPQRSFLLASCLQPVSKELGRSSPFMTSTLSASSSVDQTSERVSTGLYPSLLSHDDRQPKEKEEFHTKPKSWANTETYSAVQAFVQKDSPVRVLGKELKRSMSLQQSSIEAKLISPTVIESTEEGHSTDEEDERVPCISFD
jgi:serine/threonine protein kinase